MSISDLDGTLLMAGRKLTVDRPLNHRETHEALPLGDLWLLDVEGTETDPGLRDLGGRVRLYYVEAE